MRPRAQPGAAWVEVGSLAGRKFAVIADEAHSSQSKATAGNIREMLSDSELADVDEGGEASTEDRLAALASSEASTPQRDVFRGVQTATRGSLGVHWSVPLISICLPTNFVPSGSLRLVKRPGVVTCVKERDFHETRWQATQP